MTYEQFISENGLKGSFINLVDKTEGGGGLPNVHITKVRYRILYDIIELEIAPHAVEKNLMSPKGWVSQT